MGGGHHDISMFKGAVLEARRHQATDMAHVTEKVCTDAIAHLSEATVFDLTRVGRCTRNDELRLELLCLFHEFVIIDKTCLLVASVLL